MNSINPTPASMALGDDFVVNEMIQNFYALKREDLTQKDLFDPRRDIDKECGWPVYITNLEYKLLYDRNPIANRVISLMPSECWVTQPEVYENKEEDPTEFEEAWKALPSQLSSGNSWYQPGNSEGNKIWSKLHQLDEISGICSFGILFIGFDDGLPYYESVLGVEEINSAPQSAVDETSKEPIKNLQLVANSESGVYKLTTNVEKTEGRKLTFLRPLPETQVQIESYETNISSPRYGKPTSYLLDLTEAADTAHAAQGAPVSSFSVHWSRVLHVAEKTVTSEVFGTPRAQQVFNNLLNIRKISGSGSEGYWSNAFPIINFGTHPQLGADVTLDRDNLKAEMDAVYNKLKRYIATSGLVADPIQLDIKDPTPFIDIEIEQICIKEGVPKRIFLGSERGELASSQDARAWNKRVMLRQKMYVSVEIISEFIDVMIQSGVLPEPESFSIEWPDLNNQTETEKVDIGLKRTEAMSKYVLGGAGEIMTEFSFYTLILGLSDEDAQTIIEENDAEEPEEEEEDIRLTLTKGQDDE